jgi:type II secretory pathway pseudopilin PulG
MYRLKPFTLMKILVGIVIIAILAIVVILNLKPSQYLLQTRDSNRLADLANINAALGNYVTHAGSSQASLGSPNTVYISIPDPSATSTAGDHCEGLSLPPLLAGYSYHCAGRGTYRAPDGTGWLPVNLKSVMTGNSLSQLPIDPVNNSSSGLYYTYVASGASQYMVTAIPESQKQKSALGQAYSVPLYPNVMAQGTAFNIHPLFNTQGLVGYWPMDEGTGASATDLSGNGSAGRWNGGLIGGSHYSTGKIGGHAGNFNGSNNSVSLPNTPSLSFGLGDFSVAFWMNPSNWGSNATMGVVGQKADDTTNGWVLYHDPYAGSGKINARLALTDNFVSNSTIPNDTWTFVVFTRSAGKIYWYIDGTIDRRGTNTANIVDARGVLYIGYGQTWGGYYAGLLDDVRIYNRALSAAEIAALYNSGK